MSNLRQRVAAGIAANASGHIITIGIQLASLPLYLSRWGTSDYGVWLMLSAVPAYFSMSDVGMVTAAGNRMTMAMGRGDAVEANRVFQSAFVFMVTVCLLIAVITLPVIAFAPLPGLTDNVRRLALGALVIGVLLALFNGLAESLFRSTGRYGLGTSFGHGLRLLEWGGAMVGLFAFGDFGSVALGSLLARGTGMLAVVFYSRRHSGGIYWGTNLATASQVKALAAPALLFMAFPLANALSLQGYTLLVGNLFGPSMVAIFGTYRTLARVAVQATSTLSQSVAPELSRLAGAGLVESLASAYRKANRAGISIAIALSVVLFFLAPTLLRIWTHGSIIYLPGLMGIMLAYAAVTGFWHVPRILLLSTNQHHALALLCLCVSACSLLLGLSLGQQFGIIGLASALAISEAAAAAGGVALARKFLSFSARYAPA